MKASTLLQGAAVAIVVALSACRTADAVPVYHGPARITQVKPWAAVVHEPDTLYVSVRTSACVQDVQVYAGSADGQDTVFSSVTPPQFKGELFVAFIPFSKADETGRWYIESVFAQPCSGHSDISWSGTVPFRVRQR